MFLFWLVVITALVVAMIVAGFIYGPYIIEAMVDKLDEWVEIIEAFREEKTNGKS